MVVLLVVVGVILLALVIVLVAVHKTRPERFSLGVQSTWGHIGLHVERPFYADHDRDAPQAPSGIP